MLRNLRSQHDFQSTTLRNQLTSLVLYEFITTTEAKAKRLAQYADHFFHKIRLADLNAHKLAHATLLDKNAVRKVFEEIMPRYKETDTNFIKMIKMAPRKGDNAAMALVSLIKTLSVEPKADEPKVTEKKPSKAAARSKK